MWVVDRLAKLVIKLLNSFLSPGSLGFNLGEVLIASFILGCLSGGPPSFSSVPSLFIFISHHLANQSTQQGWLHLPYQLISLSILHPIRDSVFFILHKLQMAFTPLN